MEKLINSSQSFYPSTELMSVVLLNKFHPINYKIIEKEIRSHCNNQNIKICDTANEIYKYIIVNNLLNPVNYEKKLQIIKNIDYFYDITYNTFPTNSLFNKR